MFNRKYFPIVLFLISVFILFYTSYPSTGWWDSGFLAACAYNVGIPGPAGSLLFVLLGRIFSIFLFFIPAIKAITLVNIVSTSAAAVFLYFTLLEIHKNLKLKIDENTASIAAFVSSLSLPFLYSIWTETGVTKVYTLGLFLTGVLLYMSVKIWFSEDENQKLKLFLLVIFIMGIDFTAHRLNSPFQPVILILLILPLRKNLLSLKFWAACAAVFTLSFSLHLYLLKRAQHYPQADVGFTYGFKQLYNWINMSRINSGSNFLMLFERRAPLWDYQIKHMYLRYFVWNFIGKDGYFFLFMPIIFAGIGFLFNLIKRFKIWILLFSVLMFFSIILVFYLNVVEGFHKTREIDRLFLPSFYIFHVWTGIGVFCVLHTLSKILSKIKRKAIFFQAASFLLLIVLVPLNIILNNWDQCKKNGHYFAEDFAYNFLNSCEKDAVLFTNGDSDTFPLWYLQYVEGYRTDISVINLSLLNMKPYVELLTRSENSFSIDASLLSRENLNRISLKDTLRIKIPPPEKNTDTESVTDTLIINFAGRKIGDRKLMFVQDQVLASFLKTNRWKRPVYFAFTCSQSNLLNLQDNLAGTGTVRKLIPEKEKSILADELEKNLTEVYKFRNFNNPDVKIDRISKLLFGNYRFIYASLINYYIDEGDKEKAAEILNIMRKKLPDWRFTEKENEFLKKTEKKLNQ